MSVSKKSDQSAVNVASTGTQESEEPLILSAKINSARMVANILTTIHIKKDQTAYCEMSKFGLKFTVEKASILQADVFLKEEMFQHYFFNASASPSAAPSSSPSAGNESVRIGINLTTLLECLNLFGATQGHVLLHIAFSGKGSMLQIHLEENGVVSSCELATIDIVGPMDFGFRASQIINRVIFQASVLKDSLAELQWWGDIVKLKLAPSFIRLSASGPNGTCELDFPEGGECFDMFDCRVARCHSYKMSLLTSVMRALTHAEKVAVRLAESGMLSLQLMLREDLPVVCIAEFLICCDIDDEENDMVFAEGNNNNINNNSRYNNNNNNNEEEDDGFGDQNQQQEGEQEEEE